LPEADVNGCSDLDGSTSDSAVPTLSILMVQNYRINDEAMKVETDFSSVWSPPRSMAGARGIASHLSYIQGNFAQGETSDG
jgi:hypothetical protein